MVGQLNISNQYLSILAFHFSKIYLVLTLRSALKHCTDLFSIKTSNTPKLPENLFIMKLRYGLYSVQWEEVLGHPNFRGYFKEPWNMLQAAHLRAPFNSRK